MAAFALLFWPFQTLAEIASPGALFFDGRERVHYLHVPKDAGPDTPLVIALHGMGGNAANLRNGIGLTEEMAALGIAVVYPQGVRLPQGSRHWNAGFDYLDVDDIGYLTALARTIVRDHGLSGETMVFGISMGGYMAYHMACYAKLDISAIIVVAGSMHPSDVSRCKGTSKTSLLHIHGAQDPLIPFAGGGHWSDPAVGATSVSEIVSGWAGKTGALPAPGAVKTTSIEETRFLAPDRGVEVQLLKLTGFGHDWPSEKTAGYAAMSDITRFIERRQAAMIAENRQRTTLHRPAARPVMTAPAQRPKPRP